MIVGYGLTKKGFLEIDFYCRSRYNNVLWIGVFVCEKVHLPAKNVITTN